MRLAVRGARADHLDLTLEAGGDPLADPSRALVADHGGDARAAEAEVELGLLERRVDRDDGRAHGGDRVEAGNEPGVVAQHQADRVAWTYAPPGEPAGEALDPLHQVGERDALVPVDERSVPGPGDRLLVEELHQHRLSPLLLDERNYVIDGTEVLGVDVVVLDLDAVPPLQESDQLSDPERVDDPGGEQVAVAGDRVEVAEYELLDFCRNAHGATSIVTRTRESSAG